MKTSLQDYAFSRGAQLFSVSGIANYDDYLDKVRNRLNETGAGHEDFMNPVVGDKPGSADISFFELLSDVRKSMPDAKSIILLGVYAYDESAIYKNTRRDLKGKIARTYSYYPVVRQIAEDVTEHLKAKGHRAIQGQHVPLKYLASQTGLGVYGKNGIFQTPGYGSYVAFRNVITDLDLDPDSLGSFPSPCEDCDKCIRACPTGALYAPFKVNPRLCINPIGRRPDDIPLAIRSDMQNWIIGCDICQEVCPSNRDLIPREKDPRSGFDPEHHVSHKYLGGVAKSPSLIDLVDARYPDMIRRNAIIGLANNGKGKTEALAALEKQLGNASGVLMTYLTWAIWELNNP